MKPEGAAMLRRLAEAARIVASACDALAEGRSDEGRRLLTKGIVLANMVKEEAVTLAAERRELFEAVLTVFGATLGRDTIDRLWGKRDDAA